MKRRTMDRKAQAFILLGVLVGVGLFGIVGGTIYFHYLTSSKTDKEHLGLYQSAMVSTLAEGDRALLYIDNAARYAAVKALDAFARNGGVFVTEGVADESPMAECGRYVYNLWNSENKNCYPGFNVFGEYMGVKMREFTAMYDNPSMKKTISYAYTYKPASTGSDIYALAADSYEFYIYKDGESAQSNAEYAKMKSMAGGVGNIPGVPYIKVPNFDPTDGQRDIRYIVIHYTAGSSIAGAMSRFEDPRQKASSHYIVGSTDDGYAIVQPVSDGDVAWHAGCGPQASYRCAKPEYLGMNSRSIGIEVVNLGYDCNRYASCNSDPSNYLSAKDVHGGPTYHWQRYPKEQMDKLVLLTALIAKRYNIPIDRQHIIGHEEVVAGGKVDPGPAFDWNSFIPAVATAAAMSEDDLIAKINGQTAPVIAQAAATASNAPSMPTGNVIAQDAGTGTTAALTPSAQRKFDETKKMLMTNKLADGTSWLDYAIKAAAQKQLPAEVLLGVITRENDGTNAVVRPGNKAVGIVQVEAWQHYDTIAKTCGAEYISECSRCTSCDMGKRNDCIGVRDCCSFTKFHDDVACQLDVAAQILKDNYDAYSSGSSYEDTIKSRCSSSPDMQRFLSYTDWERAVRAYNGLACGSGNPNYVEEVMQWAQAWGYSTGKNYISTASSELEKGIVGTYYLKPSFKTHLDFDMGIIDALSQTMKDASKQCSSFSDTEGKRQCIFRMTKEFNDKMKARYPSQPISLGDDCESGAAVAVKSFIENVEDCEASNDIDCECMFRRSDTLISLKSDEMSTQFKPQDGSFAMESYNVFLDDSNKPLSRDDVALNSVVLVKERAGFKLKPLGYSASKTCAPIKNKFALCLKTDYKNESGGNMIMKFSITIHDDKPPAPLTGLTLLAMEHTDRDVIAVWDEGKEKDIASYKLYTADSQAALAKPIAQLQPLPSKTLDIINNGYDEYKDIAYDKPICELRQEKLQDGSEKDYCIFKYDATDMQGEHSNITLLTNKLYRLADKARFLYIFDGDDKDIKFSAGKDKYIAVTAIDSDGNEIDNAKDGQKLAMGKSMSKVRVVDAREPGFVTGISYDIIAKVPPSEAMVQLKLSFDEPLIYIDGTDISSGTDIRYLAYFAASCDDKGLTDASGSGNPISKGGTLDVELAKMPHCIIITSSNGKEYKKGIAKSIS